jgi:hypothetical protein
VRKGHGKHIHNEANQMHNLLYLGLRHMTDLKRFSDRRIVSVVEMFTDEEMVPRAMGRSR